MDDVRGGWTGVCEGSGGGGVSTICGTGLRSKEVIVEGGDFAGGGDFRISGMLTVLVRLISSLLNTESNADGPEEPTPAAEEVAGLEKFVGPDLATLGPFEGSFRVCAKFGTSMDKFGRGGIAGTPVSGDSGRLPDGLPAIPRRAARWAYVPRSALPFTLPPRLYVVLVDLFKLEPGTEGSMISPVSSSDGGSGPDLVKPGVFATKFSNSCKFGSCGFVFRDNDLCLSRRSAPSW